MSTEEHLNHSHKKLYFCIGAALLTLTVITVTASWLDVSIAVGVLIALFIATFKASLVASFFMHLKAEKQIIYIILVITVLFFAGMMILIPISSHNVPEGTEFLNFKDHHSSNGKGDAHQAEAHH